MQLYGSSEERVAATSPIKSYLPWADLQGLTPHQSAFQRTHPVVRNQVLNWLRGMGHQQAYNSLVGVHRAQSQVDALRAMQGRPSPYKHPSQTQPYLNPMDTTLRMRAVSATQTPGQRGADDFLNSHEYWDLVNKGFSPDHRDTEHEFPEYREDYSVYPGWDEAGPTRDHASIAPEMGDWQEPAPAPHDVAIEEEEMALHHELADNGYTMARDGEYRKTDEHGNWHTLMLPGDGRRVHNITTEFYNPKTEQTVTHSLHNNMDSALERLDINEKYSKAQSENPELEYPTHFRNWVRNNPDSYTAALHNQFARRGYSASSELSVKDYDGTEGNNNHITRNEQGMIPLDWVRNMPGLRGERPGEHRNYEGPEWDEFRENVRSGAPGYSDPIFIMVEHGEEPKIAEGNHRRDAYAELGATHVPAEIRYFGHAEKQGTVGDRAMRRTAAYDQEHVCPECGWSDKAKNDGVDWDWDSFINHLEHTHAGPWYHGTYHTLAPGTELTPGVGKPNFGPDSRDKVWFTSTPGSARIWANDAINAQEHFGEDVSGLSPHVYEVEPTGPHRLDWENQENYNSAYQDRETNHPVRVIREVHPDEIDDDGFLRKQAVRQGTVGESAMRHTAVEWWEERKPAIRRPDHQGIPVDRIVYDPDDEQDVDPEWSRIVDPDHANNWNPSTDPFIELKPMSDSGPGLMHHVPVDRRPCEDCYLNRGYEDSWPVDHFGRTGHKPMIAPRYVAKVAAIPDESGLKAAGIAVIAMDTGRVLMQQRALNPLMCPCGQGVTWDEMNGYQHDDGSVDHDDEFEGQSVSDLLDQGHPEDEGLQTSAASDEPWFHERKPAIISPLKPDEYGDPRAVGYEPDDEEDVDPGWMRTVDPDHLDNWNPSGDPFMNLKGMNDAGLPFTHAPSNGSRICETCYLDRNDQYPYGEEHFNSGRHKPMEAPRYVAKTAALEYDPNEGTWEFPGGKLDPGESAKAAAIREFREEVGQDLPPGVFVGAWVSPGGISVTAAAGWVDPEYQKEFHEYLDREVGYSPEDFAAMPPSEQRHLADGFGRYIGEDHPLDARYHLDVGGAGKQKVRTGRPGTTVRVLRIEKPDGTGPFAYGGSTIPRPFGSSDDDDQDLYTLLNPRDIHEDEDPDAGSVKQRQPYADGIPARYVRGRSFGFLPQHSVHAYFTPKMLSGLHERGFGMSEYDVPGDSLVLGRTQVAWRPEDATLVSHTPLTEHIFRGRLSMDRSTPEWWRNQPEEGRPEEEESEKEAKPRNALMDFFVTPFEVRQDLMQRHNSVENSAEGPFYHGTIYPHVVGDEIDPNNSRNYFSDEFGGPEPWGTPVNRVFFTRDQDAAARYGEEPGGLFRVEPTGPYSEHPWEKGTLVSAHPLKIVERVEPKLGKIAALGDWRELGQREQWRIEGELNAQHPTRDHHTPNSYPAGYVTWKDREFPITKEDEYNGLDQPMVGFRGSDGSPTDLDSSISVWHSRENDPACATCWNESNWVVPQSRHKTREPGHPFVPMLPEPGERRFAAAKKTPVYKCFIYLIQSEKDIDLGQREIHNPDDPDGDMSEQSAWWEIEHAKKNPALRPEVKNGTPWDELELWADKSVRNNKEIKEAVAKLAMGLREAAAPRRTPRQPFGQTFDALRDVVSAGRPDLIMRGADEVSPEQHEAIMENEFPKYFAEKDHDPNKPRVYAFRSGDQHSFLVPVTHHRSGAVGWLRGHAQDDPSKWTVFPEKQFDKAVAPRKPQLKVAPLPDWQEGDVLLDTDGHQIGDARRFRPGRWMGLDETEAKHVQQPFWQYDTAEEAARKRSESSVAPWWVVASSNLVVKFGETEEDEMADQEPDFPIGGEQRRQDAARLKDQQERQEAQTDRDRMLAQRVRSPMKDVPRRKKD